MRTIAAPNIVERVESVVSIAGSQATSWSVTRSLQDFGQQGVTAATGDVTLTQPDLTSTTTRSPWRGDTPAPYTPITIDAGYEGKISRVFTGYVDTVSGSDSSSTRVAVVDQIDKLNKVLNFEPLTRLMPPLTAGGNWRSVGMQPEYVVDRILRRCEIYTTPPFEPGVFVNAPLQTSTWPHLGTLVQSRSYSQLSVFTSSGAFRQSADGMYGASDWAMEYSPDYSQSGVASASLNMPIQITMMVGQEHAASAWIDVASGNDSLRMVIRQANISVVAFGATLLTVPANAGTYTVASILFKNGTATVRTNGGHSQSVAYTGRNVPINAVRATIGNGSRIAGIQVSTPPDGKEFQAVTSWKQSARFSSRSMNRLLDVIPMIVGKPAVEILKEIASSTCCHMWFDEDGVFRWTHDDALTAAPAVATVTSTNDLLSLSYQSARDSAASAVRVTGKIPAIQRSPWPNVQLWQGSGSNLENGQVDEVFAQPGTDETWGGVAGSALLGAVSGAGSEQSRGRYSVAGATISQDNVTDAFVAPNSSQFTATLEKITTGTWKVTSVANGLTAAQSLTQKIPDLPSIAGPLRGVNLPILRGFWRATWTDIEYTSTVTGPSGGAVVEHDTGQWIQGTGNPLTSIADYLAGFLTKNAVDVDVEIFADTRLQLGDKITVVDPARFGVTITGIIQAINLRGDSASLAMSLKLRILDTQALFVVLRDLDSRWDGMTLRDMDTAWQNQNLSSLDANPKGP